MAESTGTTDTMKVCFGVLWEVEVDNDVDGLNVDTACEKVRAYEVATDTLSEVVEDTIPMRLEHLRVRIET